MVVNKCIENRQEDVCSDDTPSVVQKANEIFDARKTNKNAKYQEQPKDAEKLIDVKMSNPKLHLLAILLFLKASSPKLHLLETSLYPET